MHCTDRHFKVQEIPLAVFWSVELMFYFWKRLRFRYLRVRYTQDFYHNPQAGADFGFLVPYFDRAVMRFPTPPCSFTVLADQR